ncbi:MAG: hypothetical protein WC517_01370 [Patescibacteria group bacterium]
MIRLQKVKTVIIALITKGYFSTQSHKLKLSTIYDFVNNLCFSCGEISLMLVVVVVGFWVSFILTS